MLLNFGGQLTSWAFVICVCKLNFVRTTRLDVNNKIGYFYKIFTSTMVLLSALFTVFGGATHLTTALVYGEAAAFTTDRLVNMSLEAANYLLPYLAPLYFLYLKVSSRDRNS